MGLLVWLLVCVEAHSFSNPPYDAQKPKADAHNQPSPQLESAQDSEAGLVQGLQRGVNSARKAKRARLPGNRNSGAPLPKYVPAMLQHSRA